MKNKKKSLFGEEVVIAQDDNACMFYVRMFSY